MALIVLHLIVGAGALRAQTPPADAFQAEADASVYGMAVQADGRVLLAGAFSAVNGQPRSFLARVETNGTLDASFAPAANDVVNALAVLANGRILVGGAFTTLAGQPRSCLARLTPEGALDAGFAITVSGGLFTTYVSSFAEQDDGKVIFGGYFSSVGGMPRSSLARLNPNGTLDTNFIASVEGTVFALAVQTDGKILLGGAFTKVNGQSRRNLARVDGAGALDTAFAPEPNAAVHAIMPQPDNRIVVGGRFTTVASQSRAYLARLQMDGSLEAGFSAQANGRVNALALQADGRILVGGAFAILAGATRDYLGRLNGDGTLDTGFDAGADGTVQGVVLQPDGALLVTGPFSSLAGVAHNGLGRLTATSPSGSSLVTEGQALTWLRGANAPEVRSALFEVSTNSLDWTLLGAGVRVTGGWQFPNPSPLPPGRFRARGMVAGGQYNGSAWWAQAFVGTNVSVRPNIVVNDGNFGIRDGQFGFTVEGEAGQTVVILASLGLDDWTPVSTNVLTGGSAYFRDPSPLSPQARFYRVRSQQ